MKLLLIFLCVITFFCCTCNKNFKNEQSRSFYMGFSPHPHDYTVQAVNETYDTIKNHSDIICHHFDDGIPWQEALTQSAYHPNVDDELQSRINRIDDYQKVYVSLAPLGFDRYFLAGYWGESSNMPRTDRWEHKTFDDPEVITAYINFCRDLINRFEPDYFNYGVEVNLNWQDINDPYLKTFLIFAEAVYTTLKKEFPDLPIFISLEIKDADPNQDEMEINKALLEYSDFIGVSTYPFIFFWDRPHTTDPKLLPDNWFQAIQELAPEKPLVIAETGYIAEDLILNSFSLNLKGENEWQRDYLVLLFTEMNELDAIFIIWFCYRDYDSAWLKLEQLGFPEWHKIWKDTGLVDEEGEMRPSFSLWEEWYNRPICE